jgi:thioredoxin-dependent peroxiredoxin
MRPSASHPKVFALLALLLLTACAAIPPPIPVDNGSVLPGSAVTRGGTTTLPLLGKPLQVGKRLPAATLVDTYLKPVDLATMHGEVLLLSIVPSLDTRVCERQTHILGEAALPDGIRRISISRDLPFAQQRFADEAGFRNILFLSDYQQAQFGRATGLLVDQLYLLARAVAVVDRQVIVRYLQVVPELSHLPDMEKAFAVARQLLEE